MSDHSMNKSTLMANVKENKSDRKRHKIDNSNRKKKRIDDLESVSLLKLDQSFENMPQLKNMRLEFFVEEQQPLRKNYSMESVKRGNDQLILPLHKNKFLKYKKNK